jgi:hypothetical protein
MRVREIIAVCCENHMEHTNTPQCVGKDVECYSHWYILWHIDPLLSSDYKQRPLLGKARNIHAHNNIRR